MNINEPEMMLLVFGLIVVVIMELTKRLSFGKAITLILIPVSAASTARSYLPCGAGLQDQLNLLFAEQPNGEPGSVTENNEPKEIRPPSRPPSRKSADTITFDRNQFFGVLLVLAFALGTFFGYILWGRSGAPTTSVQNVDTTSGGTTRYEIPSAGFPSIGPQDAPIVIVEFSDFQCPFCKRFHDETYQSLMAVYPGKIRFVYRHMPLTSIHQNAFPAAEASTCADEQNAFWKYHDKLFDHQATLGEATYKQIASDLKLDTAKFDDCIATRRFKDKVQADLDFGINLGLSGTPTFFVNGLKMVGAQPLQAFQQVIDQELAGKAP